ncbi:MAG: hypothetical protein WCO33_02435 [bacterium]
MNWLARIIYCSKILTGKKSVIGRNVKVKIYGKDDKYQILRAKVDTGAYTTSIDRELAIELGYKELVELSDNPEFKKYIDKPQDEVKQKILHLQTEAYKEFKDKYPSLAAVKIVVSTNGISIRPNFMTKMSIAGKVIETKVNIGDRLHMKNRCLIGRKSLKLFLVDVKA